MITIEFFHYEKVAMERNVKIMNESWINAVWKQNLLDNFPATHKMFDVYQNNQSRNESIVSVSSNDGNVSLNQLDTVCSPIKSSEGKILPFANRELFDHQLNESEQSEDGPSVYKRRRLDQEKSPVVCVELHF